MKLPLSKIEKSKNSFLLSKKIKTVQIIFIVLVLLLFTSASLLQTVFKGFTRAENSSDILAPIVLVTSDNLIGTAFMTGPSTLITAKHVIVGKNIDDKVQLSFENLTPKVTIEARVIWKSENDDNSPTSDFAVLRIDDLSKLPESLNPMVLGSAYDATIGDNIKAIGYPSALFSVTEGTISNTSVEYNDEEYQLIQLNCDIWPGNSGGPIIDVNTEEVIGVAISGMEDEFKGINFAIYIDNLIDEIDGTEIDLFK
jgi:S1-C subfamily serine protease